MLSAAAVQFSLRLLSRLVLQSPGRNVIVSPVGLFQALSLYAVLGEEAGQQEMRKALRFPDVSTDILVSLLCRQSKYLEGAETPETKLASLTALWLGSAIPLQEAFAAFAEQVGITLFAGADVTAEKMRQWAMERTNGLLQPSLSPPAPDSANLMNATYFRGKWASEFEPEATRNRFFYRVNHLPKIAPLMRQRKIYGVQLYRGAAFDAARIPYESGMGRDLSLHILLPHRNVLDALCLKDGVTPLAVQMSVAEWDRCQSEYRDAVVDLILPRFTFRQMHDLSPILLQMGLRKAFDTAPARAGIFAPALDKVCQQVYVSVNEEGTEAAALTEIEIVLGAAMAPVEPPRPRIEKFYANRPFLFFIVEETSGLTLFAGAMQDVDDSRQ